MIVIFLLLIICVTGADSARVRGERRNAAYQIDARLDAHLDARLFQLEARLNNKVSAIEHKLSWRISDRVRGLNQSAELAYLDRMLQLVHEELAECAEGELATARGVRELQQQTAAQQSQIDALNQALSELTATTTSAPVTPKRTPPVSADQYFSQYPADCEAALESGGLVGEEGDASYVHIQPWLSRTHFQVRCHIQDNHGWTVIQRREDGSVDFFRGWRDYRNGFGTLRGEFWLGLERIYEITNQDDYMLRIEMRDWEGGAHWAEYEHFRVASESEHYRLHAHGYRGTAGDSLTASWETHHDQPFSTRDKDNDGRPYDNCAQYFEGAWWFTACFQSHLNGKYYRKGEHNDYFRRDGIQWNSIHLHSSLRAVHMMVRPHKQPYEEPPQLALDNPP